MIGDDPKTKRGHCPRYVSRGRQQVSACGRKGTVEHGGKMYCRQHVPKRTDVELTTIYAVDECFGKQPRVYAARGVLTEKQWTSQENTPIAFKCSRRIARVDVDLTPEAAIDRWRASKRAELADAMELVEELRAAVDAAIDPTPVDDR